MVSGDQSRRAVQIWCCCVWCRDRQNQKICGETTGVCVQQNQRWNVHVLSGNAGQNSGESVMTSAKLRIAKSDFVLSVLAFCKYGIKNRRPGIPLENIIIGFELQKMYEKQHWKPVLKT